MQTSSGQRNTLNTMNKNKTRKKQGTRCEITLDCDDAEEKGVVELCNQIED